MTTDDGNAEAIRAMAAAIEELAAGQVRLGEAVQQLADGQRLVVTAIEELAKGQARIEETIRELASTQQSIIRVVNKLQVDVETLIERE